MMRTLLASLTASLAALTLCSAAAAQPAAPNDAQIAHIAYTAGLIDIFPQFSRVRMLRQWAGIVDVVHDSTPILGASPVDGLFLNCGWGTGGFKAIPAGGYCFAATLATGKPHPLAEAFTLDRFANGALIDEAAASGIAH